MLRTYYALSLKANKLSIPLLFLFITSFSFGQAARISGIITNAETGETLIGANVYIRETGQGMATDLNGYYVLDNLGLESKTLVVSFLGFEQYEKALLLEPGQSQKIDVALKTEIIEMDEIDVSAEKATRQFNIQPGRVNLSTRQIKAMPSILEPDIFRTIQALPGVLTQSEFSTGLIIRGGNTDQNLILLDGITVYNPSHLGGVFSNFIVDAVKDAELIKGGYNAEYGGRLSAVLNVTSREGNRNKFDAKMNISILSVRGPYLMGPGSFPGVVLILIKY